MGEVQRQDAGDRVFNRVLLLRISWISSGGKVTKDDLKCGNELRISQGNGMARRGREYRHDKGLNYGRFVKRSPSSLQETCFTLGSSLPSGNGPFVSERVFHLQ
ncbi:hypothetical protein KM043_001971 [Ampulex compressa]|nr:hypothetical protein KM043_001971 [Ampulex compressa]